MGITLVASLGVSTLGLADSPVYSETVCTVSFEMDLESEALEPVTECINAEEGEPGSVPASRAPYVQIASRGCFYFGSEETRWVDLGYTEDGELEYGWSPDGRPGGHIVVGTAPPCSWPTVEGEEIEGFVWSRIGSYAHQSPQVVFDPPVPRGIVGVETFAALEVPAPWVYSSTSPYTGRTLLAEVRVAEVRIDWSDGFPDRFRGSDLSRLTGHPDGVAGHTYQTKSCDAPNPRCRDELGAYQVETSFVWTGWYRVGSSRRNLTIPNTSSSSGYPVAEVIPLVVG